MDPAPICFSTHRAAAISSPHIEGLIIGAGPPGLATAIAARDCGLTHVAIEQGSVADAIRRFPSSMTFFSTSEQIENGTFARCGDRP